MKSLCGKIGVLDVQSLENDHFWKCFELRKNIDLPVGLKAQISCDDPLAIYKKKQISMLLILDLLILTFIGIGEDEVCHSWLWRFLSR